jgi:recombination endonuclease VII
MPYADPERRKAYDKARQRKYDPEARKRRHGRDPEAARRAARRFSGIEDPSGERRVGPCDACGRHADPLRYDHDHATGKPRGWLCPRCNVLLGGIESDVLPQLLAYLAHWGKKVDGL